ncbi:protein inhibitor of neuronal nitric oxide synthase like protein [Babesia gibsoni]|uniref:Dynein light chain n=1 Tax=Babesia gibsoni TaxID=33632 RepID=A0AAD8LJP7_BABGI|nr:protein inhibitor of neuronal nitric oxide synthase like protein [Babesia gibsoni]
MLDRESGGAERAQGVVIKHADMDDAKKKFALDIAEEALMKFQVEKDIASYIKKEFDQRFQPTWHCVVGKSFGSYVTHEKNCFIYFYTGNTAILLFKNG